MADSPISGLPLATAPTKDQVFALVEAGITKRSSLFDIFSLGLNTVYVTSKSDLPAAVSGVITLEVKNYYIKGTLDLVNDVIEMQGGSSILGDTATLSIITTSSPSPTITVKGGVPNAASGVRGHSGIRVNNTGAGAAIRAEGIGVITFFENLLTTAAGTSACEVDGASVGIDNWTILGATNGLHIMGATNSGPIVRGFNPIFLTGKGIWVEGNITSGALRIGEALIQNTSDHAVHIEGDIQGMSFSGDAISATGNGLRISGDVAGGLSLRDTDIRGLANDGMDITGSLILSVIAESCGITGVGAGSVGLRGDTNSANIENAGIVTSSQISGVTDGIPLAGITKKDLKWQFQNAGGAITNSTNIGAFTLDSSADTTFSFQGGDGAIVGITDAGAGNLLVESTGHGLTNGTPVALVSTTNYEGLYTVANALTDTFEVVGVFVGNEVGGSWESGWVKIAGPTTLNPISERFSQDVSNELVSLDAKTLPMIFSASVSGSKSGSTQRYQFALFEDVGPSGVFQKIDGGVTTDIKNTVTQTFIRIPSEANEGSIYSTHVRPLDGTTTYTCVTHSVDIEAG